MTDIPNSNFSDDEKIHIYTNLLLPILITDMSIYIVREKNIKNSFYNFSDFYLKQRLNNDDVKIILKNKIIQLLKDKGYVLAYVFNNTGLVICKNQDDLDQSVWRSNLDFVQI
jgi:hypothetical protein